jgi:hypothetical protein
MELGQSTSIEDQMSGYLQQNLRESSGARPAPSLTVGLLPQAVHAIANRSGSDVSPPREQSQECDEHRRSDDRPDYWEGRPTDLQIEELRQSKLF